MILFIILRLVGSLVDHRAYNPYTLVGPPAFQPVLASLAVYSSSTDYVWSQILQFNFICFVACLDWNKSQFLKNKIKGS